MEHYILLGDGYSCSQHFAAAGVGGIQCEEEVEAKSSLDKQQDLVYVWRICGETLTKN